jgi:TRAP-type C4-dicarboxylate transport system permease small subunit
MDTVKFISAKLDSVLSVMLAALLTGLVITVFLQVFARNVLEIPLIWTLDVAQLIFAWCIFLGAALAIKWDAHFNLDIVPDGWDRASSVLTFIGHIGSAIVIFVLIYHGAIFAESGLDRISPALRIQEFWFFLPIPLGGVAMALFLIERLPEDLSNLRASFSGTKS